MRVAIPNDYFGVGSVFLGQFPDAHISERIQPNTELLVLTGGADIHPSTYGEPVGSRTVPSIARDNEEIREYYIAKHRKIPVVGICRGGQLIVALNGHKLFQDVTGHGAGHFVESNNRRTFAVSSAHHQMFRLNGEGEEYELLLWAIPQISKHYLDGYNENIDVGPEFKEPEAVYFPNTNSLAFQYHPEFMRADSAGRQYFFELIKQKFSL